MEILTAIVMGFFVASTGVIGPQSEQPGNTAQAPKTEAIKSEAPLITFG